MTLQCLTALLRRVLEFILRYSRSSRSQRQKRIFFFFPMSESGVHVYKSVTPPGNPLRNPFTFFSRQRWRWYKFGDPSNPTRTARCTTTLFQTSKRWEFPFFILYSNLWSSVETLLPVMVGRANGPSFRPSPRLRPGRIRAGETPPSPSPRFFIFSKRRLLKDRQLRDRGLRKMMKLFSRLSEFSDSDTVFARLVCRVEARTLARWTVRFRHARTNTALAFLAWVAAEYKDGG